MFKALSNAPAAIVQCDADKRETKRPQNQFAQCDMDNKHFINSPRMLKE
jgi:hypothetical protein